MKKVNSFFKKKLLTPFAAVLLTLCCLAAGGLGIFLTVSPTDGAQSVGALYDAAIADAVFADEEEILPLVTIEKGSKLVTWNQAGDKILLLSWHRYPDSYPAGEQLRLEWGELWTFTDREIIGWYNENKDGVSDWQLRLEQLIGLPPESGYTHVSGFWVSPEDVIRPAYVTDTASQMQNSFDEAAEPDEWYSDWFEDNTMWSYFDSAYPWTRLGYTYDWAENASEYGLTEFLVLADSEVCVEFTLTTEEFLAWMEDGGNAGT